MDMFDAALYLERVIPYILIENQTVVGFDVEKLDLLLCIKNE